MVEVVGVALNIAVETSVTEFVTAPGRANMKSAVSAEAILLAISPRQIAILQKDGTIVLKIQSWFDVGRWRLISAGRERGNQSSSARAIHLVDVKNNLIATIISHRNNILFRTIVVCPQ